jgi:hypothetical protein
MMFLFCNSRYLFVFLTKSHCFFYHFFHKPSYSFSRLFTISAQLLTIFFVDSLFCSYDICWKYNYCYMKYVHLFCVYLLFVFSQSLIIDKRNLGTKDWTSIFEKINLQQERRSIRQYWIKTDVRILNQLNGVSKAEIWGEESITPLMSIL